MGNGEEGQRGAEAAEGRRDLDSANGPSVGLEPGAEHLQERLAPLGMPSTRKGPGDSPGTPIQGNSEVTAGVE